MLNISHFSLERGAFDNKTVSFEEHFRMEHNLWHYLYFIVLIKVKDPTEFTGPESYVYEMVKVISFSLLAWNLCFRLFASISLNDLLCLLVLLQFFVCHYKTAIINWRFLRLNCWANCVAI